MYNPNVWWHVLQFVIFMAPTGYLIFKVFENKLRFGKRFFGLIMLLYVVITAAIIALTISEVSPFRSLSSWGLGVIILISIAAIKLTVAKSTFSQLFVFFILLNLQYNTFLLSHAFLDLGIMPQIMEYEYGNLLLISLVFLALLFPVVYYLLVKQFKRIEDDNILSGEMKLFFCLPAGFYLIASTLFRMEPNTLVSKVNLLPLVFIIICEFASYYAALQAIISGNAAAAERAQLLVANSQLTLWQEQYENLQFQIASDARARHDWRHHIVSVLDFVNNKDMDGLNEYLAAYKEKYLAPEEAPICDVSAVDMLFRYYKRQAKEKQIKLSISKVSMENCEVSVPDLTIVFGNLLENALEACERMERGEKYISLKIRVDGSNPVAIICENSYDGIVCRNEGKFVSRKKGGGIGLSSVENIAKKHDGSMKIKTEGNVFKVYVAI
ncbi:MAG: GHKL domain-containing protein [Oscillospiraceae bacterium]